MLGISKEEFDVLCTKEAQDLIEKNIENEPSKLALKGVSAVVCNQIKYLQRCRNKIPQYYESRCIIPPLSYEQASSSLSTKVKKECGSTFLDLTCGLGVDTLHYSKSFERVITIERNTLLSDIARENFKRLGAEHITVINTDCEDYIKSYEGSNFDLIYIDPARRDNSKRVFLLEECSPNVISLLPILRNISNKITIKLSPLFDIDEAIRIFGSNITVRTISVNDECKELCIEMDKKNRGRKIIADCIDKKGEVKEYTFAEEEILKVAGNEEIKNIEDYKYISILDVSLRKMRCAKYYYAKYHSDSVITYDEDIALWRNKPNDMAGKVYEIKNVMEYKPKLIKENLKKMGIKTATIINHNFILSNEEVKKQLHIKEGKETTLLFTTIKDVKYLFTIKI